MDNEELQSRREFFKKATKNVLPFIGAITLGPSVMASLTSCGGDDDGCDGCELSCSGYCTETCEGSCKESATTSSCSNCASSCSTSCTKACGNNCSNTCEGNATGKTELSDASGSIDGYEYVDLGLSVKWARYNVGASKPEKYGSYFGFGDPSGNNVKSYEAQSWGGYYESVSFGSSISGTSYDSARYKWGNKWRMPTLSEVTELINNCNVDTYSLNGVSGLILVSKKNGKSIFLPAAGGKDEGSVSRAGKDGYYWTGDVQNFSNRGYYFAYFMHVGLENKVVNYAKDEMYQQFSIRPVTTGTGGGSGCTGSSCSSTCNNSSTGNTCSSCGSGCSNGCKTTCSGNCPNGCQTLCGGSCNYSCGGTCTYVSAGSSCSGCARTCSTYCYRTCTLACSSSCMSCCITSSK